jgi:aerobic carbon-monoxide dehydrogenase small subunit
MTRTQDSAVGGGSGAIRLTLTVNGRERTAERVPPGISLLTALREHFDLPGSKNACEQGECGSCTLYLDGEPVCSCLVAAGQAQGREVRTVEGLAAAEGVPGAVQRAFIDCGAVQCGFCTPGLIVAVDALIRRGVELRDAVIREELAGNLCRCTGYEKIIEAVRVAARYARRAAA